MKDHEIAQLVNDLRNELQEICPIQSLRTRISRVVTRFYKAFPTNAEDKLAAIRDLVKRLRLDHGKDLIFTLDGNCEWQEHIVSPEDLTLPSTE